MMGSEENEEEHMVDDFSCIRKTDFSRIDACNHVYLDYAGAALYPASVIDAHLSNLQASLLGNPQASNPAAEASSINIETSRREILSFFNADSRQYSVIFTSSATAAMKLVADSFPFRKGSTLLLSADNHKSVYGMRDAADRVGSSVKYIPLTPDMRMDDVSVIKALRASRSRSRSNPGLFAYPAQSNFSGMRHSLNYLSIARCSGWYTLLDASAFVSNAPLDLSTITPDFVPISFYKMFGFPTGLCALIARNDALRLVCSNRAAAVSARSSGVIGRRPRAPPPTLQPRALQRARAPESTVVFEDGTPDFAAIGAVPFGLRYMQDVGLRRLADHVAKLTRQMLVGLAGLRWRAGPDATRVFGPAEARGRERGGCVAFDIVRADGSRVDARLVARAAGEQLISVGVGCFGNAGAAAAAFRGEHGKTGRSMARMGGTLLTEGVAEGVGGYWGCLRVSVGLANTEEDVAALLKFLQEFCDRVESREAIETEAEVETETGAGERKEGARNTSGATGRRRRRYNSRLGFSTGMLLMRRKGGVNADDLD